MALLYPPILSTYLPAFVQGEVLKIPYSISPYQEDLGDIKAVHVIIQEQNTNRAVLSKNLGIKEFAYGAERYINLSTEEYGFKINTYYKVQMRICKQISDEQNGFNLEFLENVKKDCSEWSTVCLIKPISKPKLIFENEEWVPYKVGENEKINTKEKENGYFLGVLTFENENEKEHLQSYRIRLYNEENKLLEDSGNVYTGSLSPNSILFKYKSGLQTANQIYTLQISYSTNNLYSEDLTYKFQIEVLEGSLPLLDLEVEDKPKYGAIFINITEGKNEQQQSIVGNYMLVRSSADSGFSVWEDIEMFHITAGSFTGLTYKDYTVTPSVFYRYGVQKILQKDNISEIRGQRKVLLKNTAVVIEDIFLYDGVNSLKIEYNPNISSYKRTILESKSETLGSPYPFIRRNADVNYRQFSLNGLISYNMDNLDKDLENEIIYVDSEGYRVRGASLNSPFLNDILNMKISIQGDSSSEGEFLINELRKVDNFNQEIYLEQIFREKVMDFLYSDKVKLFKSETEGVMLIRLMDISLTPETQLGRKLYSFSATAIEVDEPIFSNYGKYGLVDIGEFKQDEDLAIAEVKINQITLDNIPKEGHNIISDIREKVKNKISSNSIYSIKDYRFIRITFESNPYKIEDKNLAFGYKVNINGQEFKMITNVFQVSNKDMILDSNTKIIVYGPGKVTVDFIYDELAEINKSSLQNITARYGKVGQIKRTVNSKYISKLDNLVNHIKSNHTFQYNVISNDLSAKKYFAYISLIKDITIQAQPGALFLIADGKDSVAQKNFSLAVMNSTGVMHYNNENENIINGIYCYGIRLIPKGSNDSQEFNRFRVRDAEYNINPNTDTYLNFESIKDPQFQTIYFANNEAKIFYNNEWCDIYTLEDTPSNGDKSEVLLSINKVSKIDELGDKDIVVETPFEVLIDYYVELSEGYSDIIIGTEPDESEPDPEIPTPEPEGGE